VCVCVCSRDDCGRFECSESSLPHPCFLFLESPLAPFKFEQKLFVETRGKLRPLGQTSNSCACVLSRNAPPPPPGHHAAFTWRIFSYGSRELEPELREEEQSGMGPNQISAMAKGGYHQAGGGSGTGNYAQSPVGRSAGRHSLCRLDAIACCSCCARQNRNKKQYCSEQLLGARPPARRPCR
jgi:hypothetical protein